MIDLKKTVSEIAQTWIDFGDAAAAEKLRECRRVWSLRPDQAELLALAVVRERTAIESRLIDGSH